MGELLICELDLLLTIDFSWKTMPSKCRYRSIFKLENQMNAQEASLNLSTKIVDIALKDVSPVVLTAKMVVFARI